MRTPIFVAGMVLAVAVAIGFRAPRLAVRPMHGDEAMHAYKLNELWTQGTYVYDPHEFHGPTIYYATLPVMWLSGAADYAGVDAAAFRVVPLVFGLGLVLLLPLVADGLGRGAALWAALLTAVSPLMTFCSRYYVQEVLLVFFTFAAIATAWRYVRTRRAAWAWGCGLCVGLMHATKETCVIAFGCMAGAWIVTAWCQRRWPSVLAARSSPVRQATAGEAPVATGPWPIVRRHRMAVVIVPAAILAAGVSAMCYSAMFTNLAGVVDSIRAYGVYLDRGVSGGIHEHPWYYYLRILLYTRYAAGPVWSEALIVILALGGCATAVWGRQVPVGGGRPALVRFVAVYALLMVLVYSALPYKTPWSMLGFVHGLILLAGVGAAAIVRSFRRTWLRGVAAVLLLLATAQLAAQDFRTNLDPRFMTDGRNPYVYAHPLRGVERLGLWVEKLADVHPDGRGMLVRVISPDCWPLPWYLRGLDNVGYWQQPPADCDAPVVIVTSDTPVGVEDRLQGEYEHFTESLRTDVRMVVYVEVSLMQAFRAAQGG